MDKLLIAFDSTQQALRAEMMLEFLDIDIDTRPTPKEITAGCAMSIEMPMNDYPAVKEMFTQEKVDIKGFFYQVNGVYTVFKEENNGGN